MKTWIEAIKLAWKKTRKDIKDIWYPFERNLIVNKAIYNCYLFADEVEFYSIIDKWVITDIKSRKINHVTEIIITTRRPGILIGKQGRFIDELGKYLSNKLGVVTIDIEEDKLWHFNSY